MRNMATRLSSGMTIGEDGQAGMWKAAGVSIRVYDGRADIMIVVDESIADVAESIGAGLNDDNKDC